MIKFRASSLSKIMTEPKSKSEVLSVGAKTYIEDLAKEFVYGFKETFSSKYTDKGNIVEQASIDLRNDVFFTDYQKNTERREDDFLTGECDIFTGSRIIDIKSSWSLATFPATVERATADATKAGYDWQLRAYMRLWNVDESEINYCMVNTPDELVGYEDANLHYVDHIDPALRVTRVVIKRSLDLEDKIIEKVTAAREYFNTITQMIASDHA